MSRLGEGAEHDGLALLVPFWRVSLAALTSRELGELRVTLVEPWSVPGVISHLRLTPAHRGNVLC